MEGQRKVAAELGALVAILVVGFLVRSPEVLLVAVVVAMHIVVGSLQSGAPCVPDLWVQVRPSVSRIHEGDEVEVELSLENRGGDLDLVLVRAGVGLDGKGEVARWAGPLRGKRSAKSVYRAHLPRGFYSLDRIEVEGRDSLGFVSWAKRLPCPPSPLWVLPRYERLPRLALAPQRTRAAPGMIRSRQGGTGVQFFSTRPYVQGDDLRRINWKALARRGDLVVNVYEAERAADAVVVLDVRKAAYEKWDVADLLDHAVRACAAICDALIREGHRASLLLYGQLLDWVPLGCGRVHRERLFQTLARAQLASSEVFSDLRRLPVPLFPRGSSVFIVSPLDRSDAEALGALKAWGHDVLVLVLDPIPSLAKAMPREDTGLALATRLVTVERDLMLRILTYAGLRVAVWDVPQPLVPVVRSAWGAST